MTIVFFLQMLMNAFHPSTLALGYMLHVSITPEVFVASVRKDTVSTRTTEHVQVRLYMPVEHGANN